MIGLVMASIAGVPLIQRLSNDGLQMPELVALLVAFGLWAACALAAIGVSVMAWADGDWRTVARCGVALVACALLVLAVAGWVP